MPVHCLNESTLFSQYYLSKQIMPPHIHSASKPDLPSVRAEQEGFVISKADYFQTPLIFFSWYKHFFMFNTVCQASS